MIDVQRLEGLGDEPALSNLISNYNSSFVTYSQDFSDFFREIPPDLYNPEVIRSALLCLSSLLTRISGYSYFYNIQNHAVLVDAFNTLNGYIVRFNRRTNSNPPPLTILPIPPLPIPAMPPLDVTSTFATTTTLLDTAGTAVSFLSGASIWIATAAAGGAVIGGTVAAATIGVAEPVAIAAARVMAGTVMGGGVAAAARVMAGTVMGGTVAAAITGAGQLFFRGYPVAEDDSSWTRATVRRYPNPLPR